jgi:hypothetical protein
VVIASLLGALMILAAGSSGGGGRVDGGAILVGIVVAPIVLGLFAATMCLAVFLAELLGDVTLFPLTLMASIVIVVAVVGVSISAIRQRNP